MRTPLTPGYAVVFLETNGARKFRNQDYASYSRRSVYINSMLVSELFHTLSHLFISILGCVSRRLKLHCVLLTP